MKKEKQISETAMGVLSECEVVGNKVVINSGVLNRDLYVEVNEVLEGIGGKWDRKARAHVFEESNEEIREMLEGCIETGLAVPLHRGDYFFTPEETADRIVAMADIRDGQWILEPSAGEGALIDVILGQAGKKHGRPKGLDIIDNDPKRYQKLCGKYDRADVHKYPMDFLEWVPGRIYDRVVMNPPFGFLADIDHVTHAWELLKPGGKIVSIMSAGVTFRREKKAQKFRELLISYGTLEKLPANSFKFSGTGVNTVVVTLTNP